MDHSHRLKIDSYLQNSLILRILRISSIFLMLPFVCIHFVFLLLFSQWKLCSQCLGASFPTPEVILPGLLPLMPRHTPLKGKHIGMGLQNITHGPDLLPYSNTETQFHRTHKSDYANFLHSGKKRFLKKISDVRMSGHKVHSIAWWW